MPRRNGLSGALLGALSGACALHTASSAQVLLSTRRSEDQGPSPIKRVIKLLQEMKSQIETEAEADQKAYDKMSCWCTTNEKEKTKAIEDAEMKINELQAEVEAESALSSKLATKIEHMKKDIADKKQALSTAIAIREKELAAFNTEEKESVEAIAMMKNAILVLSKHQAGLLQLTPAVQESVNSALRWIALKHEEMTEMAMEGLKLSGGASSLLSVSVGKDQGADGNSVDDVALRALRGAVTSKDKSGHPSAATAGLLPMEYAAQILARAAAGGKGATAFAQQEPEIKAAPEGMRGASYNSQSGKIFGVLKQMEEEFESSLSAAQKAEMQTREEFKELKAASEQEIEASAKLLDEMEGQHADSVKALSDAKEDLETTRKQRSEDVEFLSNLNLKCKELDRQWEERSESRSLELKAVAETISILTADDARTLFQKKNLQESASASAASFLQLGSSASSVGKNAAAAAAAARGRASSTLMQAAKRLMAASKSPDMDDFLNGLAHAWRSGEQKPHEQLATIAVSVKLDAFTKVKAAIDELVADLKKEQEEEVADKAACGEEFNDNEKVTYATEQEHEDLVTKIGTLEDTIAELIEGIKEAHASIKESEVQVKQASEARKAENAAFQEEVTDQRAVQAILKKAGERMQEVFGGAALVQQEPPVQFKPYAQNAGGSPVISLIEQIIGDAKKVEQEAEYAEQESQEAYETFVKDSNAAIEGLNAAIEQKEGTKASAEMELADTKAERTSTEGRLEDLANVKSDLHARCDFLQKNFDIRQKARLQEIEALQSAKASLSGMVDSE